MKRNEKKKKATGRMTATAKKDSDQPAGSRTDATTPDVASNDGMSPTLQAHIGRQVRAVFDEVAHEPIPDHLLQLLKDLDRNGDK